MAAGGTYTQVFAITAAIAERIEQVAWPSHPTTGVEMQVAVGDINPMPTEAIIVSRRADDEATTEWAAMSKGGRDERFIVDVWIFSAMPGTTWREMWDRLEELAESVLALFHHPSTGKWLPPDVTNAEGDPVAWHGEANAERADQWGTDEGWAGQCRIAVRIAARI